MRQAAAELSSAANAFALHADAGPAFLRAFSKHKAKLELPVPLSMTPELDAVVAQFVAAQQLLAKLIKAERIGDARRILDAREVKQALATFPNILAQVCPTSGLPEGLKTPGWAPAAATETPAMLPTFQAGDQLRSGFVRANYNLQAMLAVLAGVATLGAAGWILTRDRRAGVRRPCYVESFLLSRGRATRVEIWDIGAGGAKIKVDAEFVKKGDRVELGLGSFDQPSIVAWQTRFYAGLTFKKRLSEAAVVAVAGMTTIARPTPSLTPLMARANTPEDAQRDPAEPQPNVVGTDLTGYLRKYIWRRENKYR